jgi:hypothetical protein
MKEYITIALYISVLLAHGVCAQDTEYVYKPKQQPVANDDSFRSLNCNQPKTLDQLLGEKVVFVAKTKMLQEYGYSTFHWTNNRSESVPYEALVGKTGTVTEIQPRRTGAPKNALERFLDSRRVIINLESTDQLVITRAVDDSISDVTLLSDIEEGRKRWVGKTLWYASKYLRPSTDAEVLEWKKVKNFQPVTVVAVMVGADHQGAIDFVLRFRDGREGLAGVTLSASNTSPAFLETLKRLGRKECSFDTAFLTEDPRLTHKWPANIWAAIENDRVLVGMTVDQVIFAWGEPNSVNNTRTGMSSSSQLVYDNKRYVYIDGRGKVAAIQQ